MLDPKETALAVIDVQEKLFAVMPNKVQLLHALEQMIRGAQVLGLPIVWAEQYPEGMGGTIPEIARLMPDQQPIPKRAFSLCRHGPLMDQIKALKRRHFLLVGIEAHVCVYQTATDLLEHDFEVEVVSDAIASRTPENRQIGLERTRRVGGAITSVETCLFELLQVAQGPAFKEILKIVK